MNKKMLLVLLFMFFPIISSGDIVLDKLTSCDDVKILYDYVNKEASINALKCRNPRSILEKRLISRSGVNISGYCLLKTPPVQMLDDFSCFRFNPNNSKKLVIKDILCFRGSDIRDVIEYKENYHSSSGKIITKNYLKNAAKCQISNADVSVITNILFPYILNHISGFELGFISQLGEKKPSQSGLVHGYALIDPSLIDNAPTAIEFIHLYHVDTNLLKERKNKIQIDNWLIDVDESLKNKRKHDSNNLVKIQKKTIRIESISFGLKKRKGEQYSFDSKIKLLKDMQYQISEMLEVLEFENISFNKIRKEIGLSKREYSKLINREIKKENLPYGMRSYPMGRNRWKVTKFMSKERRIRCKNNKYGRMISLAIFEIAEPNKNLNDDFGELEIEISIHDECKSVSSKKVNIFIHDLFLEIKLQVLDYLKYSQKLM